MTKTNLSKLDYTGFARLLSKSNIEFAESEHFDTEHGWVTEIYPINSRLKVRLFKNEDGSQINQY